MKDHGHINGVPYKMLCFFQMQFASLFYTVIPYQALLRPPVYKNSAVGRSGAIFLSFCKILDFGSPTKNKLWYLIEALPVPWTFELSTYRNVCFCCKVYTPQISETVLNLSKPSYTVTVVIICKGI